MSNFQIISIVSLVLMLVLVPLQLSARRRAFAGQRGFAPRLTLVDRVAYLMTILGGALLAATGLVAGIAWNGPMHGWLLILHTSASPLFAIGITALAVLWADRRQYNPAGGPQEIDPGTKVLFWLLLLASLTCILSAVLPMTPIWSTHPMETAYKVHRYSSLAVFVLGVLHFFRFAAAK